MVFKHSQHLLCLSRGTVFCDPRLYGDSGKTFAVMPVEDITNLTAHTFLLKLDETSKSFFA